MKTQTSVCKRATTERKPRYQDHGPQGRIPPTLLQSLLRGGGAGARSEASETKGSREVKRLTSTCTQRSFVSAKDKRGRASSGDI